MKHNYHNFISLIFLIILLLILLESSIRIFDLSELPPSFRQKDTLLHHSLKPNSEGEGWLSEKYFINSYGMRDKDTTGFRMEKEENEFRILLLGDSTTEGFLVNYSDTFASLLERKLNSKQTKVKYKVMNSGVSSYSPIIEYIYLREKGLILEPDLVILVLDIGDYHDDYVYSSLAKFDEKGLPISIEPKMSYLREFIRNNFYTYHFLSYFIQINDAGQVSKRNANNIIGDVRFDRVALTRSDEYIEQNMEYILSTHSYISNISELLNSKEIPFLLVYYPWAHQLSTTECKECRKVYWLDCCSIYSSKIFSLLDDFSKENNISNLNTFNKFKNGNLYPLYYQEDVHLTNKGHLVMANSIHNKLMSNKSYYWNQDGNR